MKKDFEKFEDKDSIKFFAKLQKQLFIASMLPINYTWPPVCNEKFENFGNQQTQIHLLYKFQKFYF